MDSREKDRKTEAIIKKIEGRIEALKTEYNLFFCGETNIPPEKERVNIEKIIRNMQSQDVRSGKLNFLIQNISSRFYLYNNLWLKKLTQLESGLAKRPKKFSSGENIKSQIKETIKNSSVSLNSEASFEKLYTHYDKLVKNIDNEMGKNKEDLINSIKLRMISENIIDANIDMAIKKGKIQIKIKK